MSEEQDTIVTNVRSLITSQAISLRTPTLAYTKELNLSLYDIATLDTEHLATLKLVNKNGLLALRKVLEDSSKICNQVLTTIG